MSYLSDFSKTGLLYKGTYNGATKYNINNVVTYNLKTYVCVVSTSIGQTPTASSDWDVLAESAVVSTNTIGTGTNPDNFVLQVVNGVITLNKG